MGDFGLFHYNQKVDQKECEGDEDGLTVVLIVPSILDNKTPQFTLRRIGITINMNR
jgi:hypothetical protein